MQSKPDDVASATGNVDSTPNSKLIGNTGIEKKPSANDKITKIITSKIDLRL